MCWLDLSEEQFEVAVRGVRGTKLRSAIHIQDLVEMNVYQEKFQEKQNALRKKTSFSNLHKNAIKTSRSCLFLLKVGHW